MDVMVVVLVVYYLEICLFGWVEERVCDRCVGCVFDFCDDWGYVCVVVVVLKVEKVMFFEVCCFIVFYEIVIVFGIFGERCLLCIDFYSIVEKEEV